MKRVTIRFGIEVVRGNNGSLILLETGIEHRDGFLPIEWLLLVMHGMRCSHGGTTLSNLERREAISADGCRKNRRLLT